MCADSLLAREMSHSGAGNRSWCLDLSVEETDSDASGQKLFASVSSERGCLP